MIKRLLINLVIAFSAIGLAQHCSSVQAQSNTQAAIKFDEFGDLQYSDLMARLDNLAIQLQQQPGTRAFIIIYRTRRDLPSLNTKLAGRMKNYLVNARGIPAERIVTVDGGVSSALVQELWIVQIGATPKPRDDVFSERLDTTLAWKYDEYYYYLPKEDDGYSYYDADPLEAFADALGKYPKFEAYILAYPEYYRRSRHLDPPGTALKMLKAVKDQLVRKYLINASRIRVMNGGYRKRRQIELWIVPRGEHPPIATPNTFPKRRR